MFSYRSAELIIYLVALCLCFIDECLQFSTRLNDYFHNMVITSVVVPSAFLVTVDVAGRATPWFLI